MLMSSAVREKCRKVSKRDFSSLHLRDVKQARAPAVKRAPKAEKARPRAFFFRATCKGILHTRAKRRKAICQKGFTQFPQGFPQAFSQVSHKCLSFRFWKHMAFLRLFISTTHQKTPHFLKILPTLPFFPFFLNCPKCFFNTENCNTLFFT